MSFAVFSMIAGSRCGFPAQAVLNVPLYRTDESGAVVVTIRPDGYSITPYQPESEWHKWTGLCGG